MPVHYCRRFISAARQTAYGVLTYASRRLQGQRQRQGQGQGQEQAAPGTSGAPLVGKSPDQKGN
jgi:hypothetical protein